MAQNTEYIVKKANKRIWFLRRLKALGASIQTLLDYYQKSVRTVLEFSAPLWTGGLTKTNISDIERIQKRCFKIILSQNYRSYPQALEMLEQVTLEQRRNILCKKFAKRCTRSQKMSGLFAKSKSNTRNHKQMYSAWPNKREGDDWFVRIKNIPRRKSEGQKCDAYGVKCDFFIFNFGTW